MRTGRLVGFLWIAALLSASLGLDSSPLRADVCPSHGTRFEPPDGKTLMVIGQDRDSMNAYVQATGNVPGGFMSYASIGAPWYGTSWPGTLNGQMWHHAQDQVATYPTSAIQLGLTLENLLPAINLGLHDGDIQTLGTWIQQTNRPVFLRIGYEFDGIHNEYNPDQYKSAFIRIVNRLRQQSVVNVAFVWHSQAAGTYQDRPFTDWYPGDAFVDWVGVSLFDHVYGDPPLGPGIGRANLIADFADAHNKPLMVAESTPIGRSTVVSDATELWNTWYAPVINFVIDRGAKAWSYINMNWAIAPENNDWGDSRVEMNPALKSMWLAHIANARYLHASPTLFCDELGY